MNAYTQLLNYLLSILSADTDINNVTEGSQIDQIDIQKKNLYPLAHIEAADGNFTANNFQFNVTVQILDMVQTRKEINTDKFTTNDNRQDVYNTSLQSLRRMYNELVRNEIISVSTDSGFTKVDSVKNGIYGWELSLLVEVPNNVMSICP